MGSGSVGSIKFIRVANQLFYRGGDGNGQMGLISLKISHQLQEVSISHHLETSLKDYKVQIKRG